MSFTDSELDRYARHIVLREIGGSGQQKLKKARVLCVGAGGLGAPALQYLAAAGVGTLGIIDDDVVSLSNLQRQVIHATSAIGHLKTESSKNAITAINPNVNVETFPIRLDQTNASDIIAKFDLVLDGSDNFTTRYLTNATCTALEIPLIAAAISQWEGQISLYDPANGSPCYACVFPAAPADGLAPSCAEAGVMGALPGVVGAMMATETLKHITGAGRTLVGQLALYDALWGENRTIKIAANPDCKICGHLKK